jgi:hypothetical protein
MATYQDRDFAINAPLCSDLVGRDLAELGLVVADRRPQVRKVLISPDLLGKGAADPTAQ